MLRLKCVRCGLLVPYKGSAGGLCPRCMVREDQAVEMITVSDQPAAESGGATGRLTIRTGDDRACHTITLRGELDISSSPVLVEAVAEACSAGAEKVVIDLGGVEFMDSTGLSSLLRGRMLCEKHGCEYALTPAQRPVERVFETTGLRESLRFRPRGASRGARARIESS